MFHDEGDGKLSVTLGGYKIVLSVCEEEGALVLDCPALGLKEPLAWLDAHYILNREENQPGLDNNLVLYIADPQGRADGAVAMAVYQPDGVVVGASEGGHADEAYIYCPQQMAFVIEKPVYLFEEVA